MSSREKLRRKKRQVCIGDLDSRITLQNRTITPPLFSAVDFIEVFDGDLIVWAAINTVDGKTWFDGVSTETNITHHIFIRYESTVTAETWIIYNGHRYDILKVNDLEDRGEFMKLICSDKGLSENAASQS